MRDQLAQMEARIAAVAANQHGVISVWQLRALGCGRNAIRLRVRSGRLHPLFRGAYAVGHPGVGPLGLWKAATLALGEQAFLSFVCAAMLWKMLPISPRIPHVTVRANGGRPNREGLIVHRSRTLGPEDVAEIEGIPVTSPARTLRDLAGAEPEWLVRKATRQAEFLGLHLSGIPTDGTRGELEGDYLPFFARMGIPLPSVNARIGRFNVDFSWPGKRFAIETDAITGHRGPEQMESDADLGLELARHGYELLRLTSRQLREKPREIETLLRKRLT